ncbi:MAG: hypothetical protein ABI579_03055, partial [Candidatus Sumerlaeota bacterium]
MITGSDGDATNCPNWGFVFERNPNRSSAKPRLTGAAASDLQMVRQYLDFQKQWSERPIDFLHRTPHPVPAICFA